MKIGSLNVNGIRAFGTSRYPGAPEFFDYVGPDCLCLQEVKGDTQRLKESLKSILNKAHYTAYVAPSLGKSGYSGVGLLLKPSLTDVKYEVKSVELSDFLHNYDFYTPDLHNSLKYYGSGRIIQYESDTKIIISVYVLNSGGKDNLRQYWDKLFNDYLTDLVKSNKSKDIYILGDFNVCHKSIDMWNWDKALNTSPGLMQFEIDGFDRLLESTKLTDSFRFLHPDERKYSWSAPRVPLSKGWRLDYALVSDMSKVISSNIDSTVRCSDHLYIQLEVKD
jgi:exodeoxyribonuclease III